jgi:diguanylate cyclase (GGDEF)-like protein/PAS domain S-box-containing protein
LLIEKLHQSLSVKLMALVGTAMVLMIILLTFVNVSNLSSIVKPLIVKNLNNALSNTVADLHRSMLQTAEDVQIIKSHNALNNFLDYEMFKDEQGMNNEIVELEPFVTALSASKPQYTDIEILTLSGSILKVSNGLVAESSVNSGFDLDDNVSETKVFKLGERIFYRHSAIFKVEQNLPDSPSSAVKIVIQNDVTPSLKRIINNLQDLNIHLNIKAGSQEVISNISDADMASTEWLLAKDSHSIKNIEVLVGMTSQDAYILLREISNSAFFMALSLIVVSVLSLYLTIKKVVAAPLTDINQFIQDKILSQKSIQQRYQTSSKDEIGVFAEGLNEMLEQLASREQALSSSEKRLSLALKGSGEGMWQYHIEDQKLYLDGLSCELFGFDMPESTFDIEVFADNILSDEKNRLVSYCNSFNNDEAQAFELVFQYRAPKGKLWLQMRGELQGACDSVISPVIIGTFRDITLAREADAQIRLYATAFESSGSAILILDKNLKVLAANRAHKQITGFSFKEIVGKQPEFTSNPAGSSLNYAEFLLNMNTRGNWSGELIGKRKNGGSFIQDINVDAVYADVSDQQRLTHYVCVFSDVTQKKKSEKDLWTMANFDMLTRLPNRAYFHKELEKFILNATHSGGYFTLLFLDLDRFKHVNDTLGHEVGDRVLIEVANKLIQSLRKNDFVARIGGDEFVVILEDVHDGGVIKQINDKVFAHFIDGFVIDDKDTGVGLSIGVATFPKDSTNSDDLLHCADLAMYHAKNHGKNGSSVFTPLMSEHINRRNLIEFELRKALENNELTLFYQPQISLNHGSISSFEALTRWRHETLGEIFPDEFIAIAEESELIVTLGRRALENACAFVKTLHDAGFMHISVAVNVSAKQFTLSDIVSDVATALDKAKIEASALELELTESIIVSNPEEMLATLINIKALGVRLSIDDFGTGYSSLSYLSRFPLDVLKIDKSFIKQLGHNRRGTAITQSVIAIAKSLDLDVVAEGVETVEQHQHLVELGVELVQGFLFSRPISAEDAMELLINNKNFITKQSK